MMLNKKERERRKYERNHMPKHIQQMRKAQMKLRLAQRLGIEVRDLSPHQIEIESMRLDEVRRNRRKKRKAKVLAEEIKRNAPLPQCRACGKQFMPIHCQKICSDICRKEMSRRSSHKKNKSAKGKQYHKEYSQRPEVIAKRKTPEAKAALKKYAAKYYQRPEVKERSKKRYLEGKANARRLPAFKKNG